MAQSKTLQYEDMRWDMYVICWYNFLLLYLGCAEKMCNKERTQFPALKSPWENRAAAKATWTIACPPTSSTIHDQGQSKHFDITLKNSSFCIELFHIIVFASIFYSFHQFIIIINNNNNNNVIVIIIVFIIIDIIIIIPNWTMLAYLIYLYV